VLPTGKNPITGPVKGEGAGLTISVARPNQQAEYSLETVLAMLRILEPLDIRAAVALGLAYFAALRPAEIRGLQWADYDGARLDIKRSVWRGAVGQTKTESSGSSVPVIEPLRSLLEKMRLQSTDGYICRTKRLNHSALIP
jgi:integrase